MKLGQLLQFIDLKIYTDRTSDSGPTNSTYPVIKFYQLSLM